jgi:hypothetical protein
MTLTRPTLVMPDLFRHPALLSSAAESWTPDQVRGDVVPGVAEAQGRHDG